MVRGIARKAKEDKMPIRQAFIFGSYAKNRMNEYSDLDLCFISRKFKNIIDAEAYLMTEIYYLNPKLNIPIDVVAYHPKDFIKTAPLVYEIQRNGREVELG